jgi:hypothetical protein
MEKVVNIRSIKDNSNDFTFWLTKTPTQRIAALELLRQHYLSFIKDAPQRLQRVYRIIDIKNKTATRRPIDLDDIENMQKS